MPYIKCGFADDGGPTESGVLELIRHYDYDVYCPDGQDELDAYENLKRGLCMTCGRPLGENTVVLVNEAGILGLWCEGICLQDLQSLGLIREMEEYVVDRIDRRADRDDSEGGGE